MAKRAAPAPVVTPSPSRVDRYGDPLPPGAVTRLGTLRWRATGSDLTYSADGRVILVCQGSKVVRFDASTGARLAPFTSHGESLTRLLPTRDGRWLVGCTGVGRVCVLDPETGALVTSFDTTVGRDDGALVSRAKPSGKFPMAVAFSADGRALITASGDATALVWDLGEVLASGPAPKRKSRAG